MSLSLWLKKKLFLTPVITASTVMAAVGTLLYAAAKDENAPRGVRPMLAANEATYEGLFMKELTYELDRLLKTNGVGLEGTRKEVYSKLGNVKLYHDKLEALDDVSSSDAAELKKNFNAAALSVLYDAITSQRGQSADELVEGKKALATKLSIADLDIPVAPLAVPETPVVEVNAPASGADRKEVVAYFNQIAANLLK